MRPLILILALFATPAHAIVSPQMPSAMEEAPVARALANVEQDQSLAPAQRERLLGRLHLIAYAQSSARLTRYANGEWQPEGQGPCGDGAYARPDGRDVCPYGYQGLRVSRELPRRARAQLLPGDHLVRARGHYERSLGLDDTNLRAHLGLAYVLDQMRDRGAALVHLRRIIGLAEPLFQRNFRGDLYLDWESYAVLNEAVEHLSSLARSHADRSAVARLRQRLGASQVDTYITPTVAPLTDASFSALVDNASPVAFDFAGTGDTRAQGWITPDAAWLVWDPNRRGDIRSGFDMIGQRTWAVFWTDGFEAMRSLDDDGDGELAGAELGGLALWRDADRDGVSDPGEVLPLAAHGVVGLAVRGALERPDLITAPAGVRLDDGRRRPLYDWTPGFGLAPNS